jgi:hypothetical protein
MEERDPFGRDKDEDPLAEMGWSSGERTDPLAGPADIATPELPDEAVRAQAAEPATAPPGAAPPRAPAPRRPVEPGAPQRLPTPARRRGLAGFGCVFSLVVLTFIIGIGAIVVSAVIEAVDDEIDSVLPRPVPPEGEAPQGLERGSLLRRRNLAPALDRLHSLAESAGVRFLRVAPDRIEIMVALNGGRSRLLQARWDGSARVISTSPGGGGDIFRWPRINPSAPRRIVTATTGDRPQRFDYAVLSTAGGLRWAAFLKDGTGFTATPDGRRVTPLGG